MQLYWILAPCQCLRMSNYVRSIVLIIGVRLEAWCTTSPIPEHNVIACMNIKRSTCMISCSRHRTRAFLKHNILKFKHRSVRPRTPTQVRLRSTNATPRCVLRCRPRVVLALLCTCMNKMLSMRGHPPAHKQPRGRLCADTMLSMRAHPPRAR